MTPRAGTAPAVMDSRSLFASRIPEDLSPPSLGLQSLWSLMQPTLTNILWMGRDSSRLWDVPATQTGATRPKLSESGAFQGLCNSRGKTRKWSARVSQDHPQKGETRELMGCVPRGKQSLGTCRVQKGKSK